MARTINQAIIRVDKPSLIVIWAIDEAIPVENGKLIMKVAQFQRNTLTQI